MMPAQGDGGAVGRSGRKSRANAGSRLNDILQQEAKDLKTLEAEADQETEEEEEEEAAPAAAAPKKTRQRQQQQQHDPGPAAINGVGRVKSEAAEHTGRSAANDTPAAAAAAGGKASAVKAEPAEHHLVNANTARSKPAPAAVAVTAAAGAVAAGAGTAAAAAAAAAAAGGAPAGAGALAAAHAPAPSARVIKAPLPRLPRPVRGSDEGPGAAVGQALGAADTACWSLSKDTGASAKQQPQQQRGSKRKRAAAAKAGTPPPEGAAEAGTEDGEDAAHAGSNGVLVQPPPSGKLLPVGSRPSWLVQAAEGGSTALNKRQARALADDLTQPQQVEFMLGCSSCEYQQHGCADCRARPEVTRPMARWQPDSGHPQVDLAEAATFTPSKEEFADPFTYIASIAEQFVKQGIAKIVPPAGCWAPPQYVQQLKAACSGGSSSGGNGSVPDDLSLDAQRQFLSHLCMRAAPAPVSGAATTAAAAGPHSSHPAAQTLEQMLGPDVALLHRLDEQAEAGPALAAEGQSALRSGSAGSDSVMQDAGPAAAAAAAGGRKGQQKSSASVKQEVGLSQQQQQQQQPGLQQAAKEPGMWRTHTLRSFAAYADWAKRMHFSCQPCNAELQTVLQPGPAPGRQRQGSTAGLPPAKRPKPDPDHQPQPSRDTGTEAEGTEDTDVDAAAESSKDAAQQQQQHPPERHSSRLQAKGRAPLHPLKSVAAAGAGRGASPEPSTIAAKAKGSKPATSTTSATPPTTPRTKAVKSGSGSRLVGAAAGMLGLAAVFPESAITMDQFEAEFWRVVEQQQEGRLVEALHVPEVRGSSGGSLVQELQEQQQQQAWAHDDPQQQQQEQEQVAGEACAWDLSSLPGRRENLLRYLPLQQSIPGLTEPVLGLSSCLSSHCWQVTPQGMYGISCLHYGAPRVWYAVPESACEAFQVAVQDCLPHLAAANPALLQQAVTAVSPNELRARGVPVCRLVQEPGTLMVLLPNAFHCWVSTGFSIHESVALAPWDCLGAGCDAERSCRQQRYPTPVSQTELLVTLVSSCRCVADAHGPGGGDIEAEADEQAAAVATAALAAVSRARARHAQKAAKQQQQHEPGGTEQDAQPEDQADQQAAPVRNAGSKQQQQHQQARKSRQRQPQRQPQKGRQQRKHKGAALESGGGSNSHSSASSSSGSDSDSESDTASAESPVLDSDSSSSSDGGGDSSSSRDDSDSEAEASQPCWGAAAGAQQLLEPGLSWASGACASAALELVPKPAILAAVGELVLRVEEEQCRQAAARHHGVQQEQRMHGTVMPVSYCGVCHADLWLSGVVSSAIPGQAVCPEHTTRLSADPSTCTLMFRHSVEELQRLLFEAAVLFPGCADDIRAAQQRVRTRPVVRGLKSLGPLMELQEELPAPRAPELKPGGREPATPVADWVKQLMALAQARLSLVGHGGAARLSHRQRRAAVEEALQVAAAAFDAVKSCGNLDSITFGQKLSVRPLRRRDEAVRLVALQLLKLGSSKAGNKKGKSREQPQPQPQQSEDSSSSDDDDEESDGAAQKKERVALHPRQRKLPGWLQSDECVVDKAVAKRAKAGAGSKSGKGAAGSAAERTNADAKATAAAAALRLAEVLPLAEQALEAVAAKRALARQERQQRRQQQEQQRRQQLQQQQQVEQRHQRQHEQCVPNGVANAAAAAAAAAGAVPLHGQQLQQLHLHQQQLLALQQQSQQLLMAAAPAAGHHRPPQARSSRESLGGAGSGGRGKGRSGGRTAAGRGDRRSSGSGGRRGPGMPGMGTEQQQQLAAQLTLQQLQLQAQFRAAALAAAAAAAGQGTPAAATVPAVSSAAVAAGAQLGQAGAAGLPAGFVGFPGPLITMHNGVPVLIFAAPLPQQSNSAAATASADPTAQAAAAAAAAPAEAGDEVQQQQEQQGQAQSGSQQQSQAEEAVASAAPAAADASIPASTAPPAAAATATSNAAASMGAGAAGGAAAAVGSSQAATTSDAAAAAAASSSGLLPAGSMQHSSGQLTDAEAAAAAAHAEAEAVATKAAAEAVAAAAAEARLVPGFVGGNGGHHNNSSSQGPASSISGTPSGAVTLAAAGAGGGGGGSVVSTPTAAQQQQASLPHALPAAASTAPVAATTAAGGVAAVASTAPAAAAATVSAPPVSLTLQPPTYQAWQQHQVAPSSAPLLPLSAGYGAGNSQMLGMGGGAQVECMLQVEEFFHSQEPGHHADNEPAVPAVPLPPPQAAAAAEEVPAGNSAQPAAPPVVVDALQAPAAADGLAGLAADGQTQLAAAGAGSVDPVEHTTQAAAAPPPAAAPDGVVLSPQAEATATATATAAAEAVPAGCAATGTQAVQPAATAAPPTSAAAAASPGVPRKAGGCDDQMDELELEPLVDGMDGFDFDW